MNSQNTSSAVMAQRKEPHDSLDFFPTPPWATRALCEKVLLVNRFIPNQNTVLDPACGEGHMARPLAEYFKDVVASDVHDYGYGAVDDFLFPGAGYGDIDWVITNPPFRLAPEFIHMALQTAQIGCAMLVRTAFVEGVKRFISLFEPTPPLFIAPFSERVIMSKGVVRDPSQKYLCEQTGKLKTPSTATSYAWFVWTKGHKGATAVNWIPPCREELEREGDYGEPRHITDIAGPVIERALSKYTDGANRE